MLTVVCFTAIKMMVIIRHLLQRGPRQTFKQATSSPLCHGKQRLT